jgi:hypothetical protein
VYEYRISGNVEKLTRMLFAIQNTCYLDDIEITYTSGGTPAFDYGCAGDDKFKWGEGYCLYDKLTITPQPDPGEKAFVNVWFCSQHNQTGPMAVAGGTRSLEAGDSELLGPGFDLRVAPFNIRQIITIGNGICFRVLRDSRTKCIVPDDENASPPIYGLEWACSDDCFAVTENDWVPVPEDTDDDTFSYAGSLDFKETCDETLELPELEYLAQILANNCPSSATTFISNAVYTDHLIDKSIEDTSPGCSCPPCIRVRSGGRTRCICP